MTRIIKTATLSGIMIGLASALYVSLTDSTPYGNVLGALCFGFALLYVIEQELWLFTGRVGILFEQCNKWNYILQLIISLFFNTLGILAILWLVSEIGGENFLQKHQEIYNIKTSFPWQITFLKGVGCGALMYVAVSTKKVLVTIICVAAFLLLGFAHCVADIFYFGIHYMILVIALGNAIGAIAMNWLNEKTK